MQLNPSETETFVALARHQIVSARTKLASPDVTPEEERALWQLLGWLESIIRLRVGALEVQLEQIDCELERRLRR